MSWDIMKTLLVLVVVGELLLFFHHHHLHHHHHHHHHHIKSKLDNSSPNSSYIDLVPVNSNSIWDILDSEKGAFW